MYSNIQDNTRIILGFGPDRFPSEPGGPRLREHMRTLVARAIEALPPSFRCPTLRFAGHGSRSTPSGTRSGTQICGVQYSIPNRFRIDTPKRLKIAATQRKQSSRLISNRYKNRGVLRGAIRSGSRSAGPFAPAQGRPPCPELSKGFRPELDCKSHSAGKFRGTKNY
jgi:hypothetical protein